VKEFLSEPGPLKNVHLAMLSRYYICTCLVLLRVKARPWNKHSNGWYTRGNSTTGNIVFMYINVCDLRTL